MIFWPHKLRTLYYIWFHGIIELWREQSILPLCRTRWIVCGKFCVLRYPPPPPSANEFSLLHTLTSAGWHIFLQSYFPEKLTYALGRIKFINSCWNNFFLISCHIDPLCSWPLPLSVAKPIIWIWNYSSKVYLGSCVQLYSLAETPQHPPSPAFGLIYEGAIGQPR